MKTTRILAVLSLALALVLVALYEFAPSAQAPPPPVIVRPVRKPAVPVAVLEPLKRTPAPQIDKRSVTAESSTIDASLAPGLTEREQNWLEDRLLAIEPERKQYEANLAAMETRIRDREAVEKDPQTYVHWSQDFLTMAEYGLMEPAKAIEFERSMDAREEAMQISESVHPKGRRFWIYEARDYWQLKLQELDEEEDEIFLTLDGLAGE